MSDTANAFPVFGSERTESRDPDSGRTVIRWTASAARDNHLYFTSPSVTADDRWLVFLSERTGRVNLFAIERATGRIHQVSANRYGVMRSYCWPWGGENGLSKASPALDLFRNRVYYIQDGALWGSSIETPAPARIWTLPVGWWSNFTHVSPDGKTLCVPLVDPRAFPSGLQTQMQQLLLVPPIMREAQLCSRIYLVDVETGEATVAAEPPFWVSHVQFDPAGSGRILFNQEGISRQERLIRTWCLENDGSFRPLYDQPLDETAVHENWSFDGTMIVYHGYRKDGSAFFAARDWNGKLCFEERTENPGGPSHYTPTCDGSGFVTDEPGGALALFRMQAGAGFERSVVCWHGNRMDACLDQDDHVHPLMNHDGQGIVFTSNRDGLANVYEVRIGAGAGA